MAESPLVLSPLYLAAIQKAGAIWGSEWRQFMGIPEGMSGPVQEYTGTKGDNSRAFYDAWVRRCVNVRGDAITQAPLRVFEPIKGKRGRQIVDHDAVDVIMNSNPMGWLQGDLLLRATLASLDLHGHYCWTPATDSRGIPTEVYFMPPLAYEPMANKKTGFFDGVKIRERDQERIIPAKQLVYDSTMSLDNPVKGASRIDAAKMDLNLRAYGQQSNLWFLRNNMRPDWMLSGDFLPTKDNVDMIRRQINEWAGGDNRRGPLILGGGNMKASLLTMQAKDAEWVQQQRLSQEALAALFGVPMPMMNVLENATLANVDAYKLQFWHDTMTPELKNLGRSLTRNFLYRWPDAVRNNLELGFDLSEVEGLGEDLNHLWEREFQAAKLYTESLKDRGMTPNQWRAAMVDIHKRLGIDSAPWEGEVPQGDEVLVNWNFIPASQANAQTVFDAMALRGPSAPLVQNIPGFSPGVDFEDAADQLLADQQALAGPPLPGPAPKPGGKPSPTKSGNIRSMPPAAPTEPQETRNAGWPTPAPVPIRDRRLQPIQAKFIRQLKVYFQDLQRQALKIVRAKADQPPNDPWDREAARKEIERLAREILGEAGAEAYEATKSDYGVGVGIDWTFVNPWLTTYMGQRMGMIYGIEQTTLDGLRKSLTEGAQAGESIPQLADRVTQVFRQAIDSRATTIARTETIQAYAAASLQSYRDANVEKVLMYDGPHVDEADCIHVNGQIVSVDEAEELMKAEHPNGVRGVSPYFDMPQVVQIPKAAEPDAIREKEIEAETVRRKDELDADTVRRKNQLDAETEQKRIAADLEKTKAQVEGRAREAEARALEAKNARQDFVFENTPAVTNVYNQPPVYKFEPAVTNVDARTNIAEGAVQVKTTLPKVQVDAPISVNVPAQKPVIIEEGE